MPDRSSRGYAERLARELPRQQVQPDRRSTARLLWRWFWIALLLRLALMLTIHFSEADVRLTLTKDAFLYHDTAVEMAEYWRSGGATHWPHRVDTFYWDCSYEWAMGALYYVVGDAMIIGKMISVLAGALAPLVFWRLAILMYNDTAVAARVLVWMALFPSHVYYSCHMVRDAPATLALALVFLGLVSLSRPTSMLVKLALPVGLLLTAGFRFYMFFVLLLMIPAAIAISWVLSPGRQMGYTLRTMFVGGIVVALGIALNIETLLEEMEARQYLDLDFLNHIRTKMNKGGGAMFRGGEAPELGGDPTGTGISLFVGLYYFFVSVDPTNMGSIRQWMAVPEVLIVLFMAPSLWRGIKLSLFQRLGTTIHVLIVTAGITCAYSAVATNAGPLMRWRLQVVGIYIIIAAVGWTLKVRKRQGVHRVRPMGRPVPTHGASR